MFGTYGLRRTLKNYFRDRAGEPDPKLDKLLDEHRLRLSSETSHSSQRGFVNAFVRLAKPYYWSQEDVKEKALAWTLLASSLALTYYNVTEVAVGFNEWNGAVGDFLQQSYNAAANGTEAVDKVYNEFKGHLKDLAILTGKMLGVGYVNYKVGQYAVLRWRKWMTEDYEDKWASYKAFYHMKHKENAVDNPDQRIQEDPAKVADFVIDLITDGFDAGLSFVTFAGILWGLSDTQTIAGVEIPKFMFTAVMAYAALGTALTHYASKPLETYVADQQMYEADYRSDLKEMHEKAEAIALNDAEDVQKGILTNSFNKLYNNYKKLINIRANLLVMRVVYHRLAGALPLAVTFPKVVSGAMQVGGVFRVMGAFSEVKNAMSWYVNNAHNVRAGKAYMNRMIDIDDMLIEVRDEHEELERLAHADHSVTESNDNQKFEPSQL